MDAIKNALELAEISDQYPAKESQTWFSVTVNKAYGKDEFDKIETVDFGADMVKAIEYITENCPTCHFNGYLMIIEWKKMRWARYTKEWEESPMRNEDVKSIAKQIIQKFFGKTWEYYYYKWLFEENYDRDDCIPSIIITSPSRTIFNYRGVLWN